MCMEKSLEDLGSIDEVINAFKPTKKAGKFYETHKPITVWIPNDEKDSYDALQEMSDQEFSKVVRDVVVLTIHRASDRSA
jgi:hypothetical protein